MVNTDLAVHVRTLTSGQPAAPSAAWAVAGCLDVLAVMGRLTVRSCVRRTWGDLPASEKGPTA